MVASDLLAQIGPESERAIVVQLSVTSPLHRAVHTLYFNFRPEFQSLPVGSLGQNKLRLSDLAGQRVPGIEGAALRRFAILDFYRTRKMLGTTARPSFAKPMISPRRKPGSTAQLKGELNLTLRYYSVRNNASSARAIVNEVVWLGENSMVEGVKEFCAKLEMDLLCESKQFPGGQVSTLFPGSFQNVLTRIAVASACRHWEIVYVEPQVGTGIRQMPTANLVTPHQAL